MTPHQGASDSIRRHTEVVPPPAFRQGFLITAALALCLAACKPGIRIQTVPVPTPVACIERDKIPAEPVLAIKLTGNAERDSAIIAAHALRLRAWGRSLFALATACSKVD